MLSKFGPCFAQSSREDLESEACVIANSFKENRETITTNHGLLWHHEEGIVLVLISHFIKISQVYESKKIIKPLHFDLELKSAHCTSAKVKSGRNIQGKVRDF